eukprot:4066066-Prymnesium_polylepis.1
MQARAAGSQRRLPHFPLGVARELDQMAASDASTDLRAFVEGMVDAEDVDDTLGALLRNKIRS